MRNILELLQKQTETQIYYDFLLYIVHGYLVLFFVSCYYLGWFKTETKHLMY